MSQGNSTSPNLSEFGRRWRRARISAVRRAIGERAELRRDLIFRYVFDHSRLLAISFTKKFGPSFSDSDLARLLKASGIPCARGRWEARENANSVSREGCGFREDLRSDACDFWREALDGLVTGLGRGERFVRLSCQRKGDAKCSDVFYPVANGIDRNPHAWKEVSPEMKAGIDRAIGDAEKRFQISVKVRGLRENRIYVEIRSLRESGCASPRILTGFIESLLRKTYPGIELMETTPVSVF